MAAHLLAQVQHARMPPNLPAIRQHLLDALLTFGIAEDAAQGYLAVR